MDHGQISSSSLLKNTEVSSPATLPESSIVESYALAKVSIFKSSL